MIDRDFIGDSKEEELKRADHLLYVTLKYTRTVDVMKNIIKRLITAIDFTISDGLKKRKIKASSVAQVRFKQLAKKIPDVKRFSKFYLMLKKIDKAKFKAESEYRKGVCLVTKDIRVDFDTLKEYFEKVKEFVSEVR